jgi:hypothetical protein
VEIYTLDSLYRPFEVCDNFVDLLWTERARRWGDFEMNVTSTQANRNKFPVGTRLSIPESYRVMTVETIENKTDKDGRNLLSLKGRSFEKVLDDRLARGSLSDLTTEPKWIMTGLPAVLARKIFHDICVTGILDAGDIIPFINETSIFSSDTISEPTESITYEVEPKSVYAALVELCDVFDMGFRLIRDPITLNLYFNIYMGSDRTTKQTGLPAVVFSPDMQNLQNTSHLTTIANYKNVAYVISPVGHEIVYPLDVDPEINGFQRNVLFVKADDIKDVDSGVASAKMIQLGKQELAKARRLAAFDGELNSNQYKYGRDYNLMDLVEVHDQTGASSSMQVTEQIWVSDKEGDRTYPTLSVNTYITAGSWLGWDITQVWQDVNPLTDWDDLP